MKRLLLLSAVPLLAAPAVLAAPPLSIPVPRPTPEQEEMIRIAEEEAQFLAEAEEAAALAAAHPAGGEPATLSGRTPPRCSSTAISRVTSGRLTRPIARRGISTRRHTAISGLSKRKLSQSRRRARLRRTASVLNLRPHTTPHRRSPSGAGATTASRYRPACFTPSART